MIDLKVNFCILVYIQTFGFINFITTYSFPQKLLTKVYIQNTIKQGINNRLINIFFLKTYAIINLYKGWYPFTSNIVLIYM